MTATASTVGRRVLLVEDDESAAVLLAHLMHRKGLLVQRLADGGEALECIAGQRSADLVLTELKLPHASGFEIIRALHANPQWQGVPVLVLTAQSAEEDVVQALDAGADDYVIKPFRHQELLARIRRHLEG